jgi:hypothetical protein
MLLLSLLMSASLGAGSTILHAREYIVEPVAEISASEAGAGFRAFRDLLVSKGFNQLDFGEKPEPNRVAFRIDGSNAGFEFRQDWEDILELTYSGDNNFRLRLVRIVHQPEDFSDDYLRKFIAEIEALIGEATSKAFRLKPVLGPS